MDTIHGQEQDEIRRLKNQLLELLKVLEQENQALQDRDLTLLESLTAEKNSLLSTLSTVRSQPEKSTAEYDVIRQLVQQCEKLNIVNGCIIQSGLRLNEQLLNIIQGNDNVPVYTSTGECNKSRSSQNMIEI